jgi:hypothetical protein
MRFLAESVYPVRACSTHIDRRPGNRLPLRNEDEYTIMPQTSHSPRGTSRTLARCTSARRRAYAAPSEPIPIWLAALIATGCEATRSGAGSAVRWRSVSGKALYTNAGSDTELIQPLGVALASGQTLAVYWTPGETSYTLEVYC